MDFPKKQAQRLMPLYLLEYSEKLFTNHPDPSAPWGGGGGSDYTAGQGITITNNEISVDTNVIATKSDISSMVTTTQLTDALDDYALKTEIPTDVSQLYNDAGYATETWVQNQGYAISSEIPSTATSTSTSTVTPTTGTFVTGTSTNTTNVVNSVTYTPSSETLTFTYDDNTTASFTFLTSSTTVTSGTTSVVTSVTDSTSNAMTGATVSTSTTTTLS